GNDRGIRAIRILPWTENVEVSQRDPTEPANARQNSCIHFVDGFGGSVGREGSARSLFDFWETVIASIHGAARGEDKSFDLGVPRRNQHVQETGDVVMMATDGVGQR